MVLQSATAAKHRDPHGIRRRGAPVDRDLDGDKPERDSRADIPRLLGATRSPHRPTLNSSPAGWVDRQDSGSKRWPRSGRTRSARACCATTRHRLRHRCSEREAFLDSSCSPHALEASPAPMQRVGGRRASANHRHRQRRPAQHPNRALVGTPATRGVAWLIARNRRNRRRGSVRYVTDEFADRLSAMERGRT